jgi:phosphohistidine phosphatase
MRVYLIRHAHAVDEGVALPDEARWLSPRGRQVARAVGKRLAGHGVSFDAVLTSPLVRAVQTAELIAAAMDFTDPVEAMASLTPGVPPRVVGQLLPSRGVSVAVVGHEPGISALGAFLLGRPSFPPFRKCQVSLVEDGVAGWWLDPETMQIERLQ